MGCDFPSDSPLSTSFFCFWTKNYFEFCSAKSSPTCLFALKDWDSCNAIRAFSANCSEQIQSGELVLKLVFKEDRRGWFGFQVGYQSDKINFLYQNCPPAIGFQKLRKPPQCLFWVVSQTFALRFSSVGSRVTAIFNSNLTTWKEKLFEKIHLQKLWRTAFVPQRGDGCERPRRVVHRLLRDDALRQAPCSQDRQPIDRA